MAISDKPAHRPAYFDGHSQDGRELLYRSTLTPESDTCRTLIVCRPDKVVPIVFVPGIMGSNLKAVQNVVNSDDRVVIGKGDPLWRVDGLLSMFFGWVSKGADEYQLRLRQDVAKVDSQGALPDSGLRCMAPQNSAMAPAPLSRQQLVERGWGEVSALFYLPFLDWLEHSLNYASKDFTREGWPDNPVLTALKQRHAGHRPLDAAIGDVPTLSEQDIDALLSCDNPVHAFGYNWLQSNAQSGRELKKRIQTIIAGYQAQGKQCEQVILVTHSMGGLVARAACKLHGAEALVAGVFHSVMPTDGAAATYKRMVAGFGGEGGGFFGWVSANVLGPRGHFTTPTLALNPGPLELLPNKKYNGGQSWLFVEDPSGQKLKLPSASGDPYTEIYTEKKQWWKPCNEEWMNPAQLKDAGTFNDYRVSVMDASAFHEDLHTAGDFHPVTHAHYGQDPQQKAYATVKWALDQSLTPEQLASLRRHDLSDADTAITLKTGDGVAAKQIQARLSQPDAPGDGTVPADAPARRVTEAIQSGVKVWGTGYSHDNSLGMNSGSEGRFAALHAILHMLKGSGAPA